MQTAAGLPVKGRFAKASTTVIRKGMATREGSASKARERYLTEAPLEDAVLYI
jgi:hypothetical protein